MPNGCGPRGGVALSFMGESLSDSTDLLFPVFGNPDSKFVANTSRGLIESDLWRFVAEQRRVVANSEASTCSRGYLNSAKGSIWTILCGLCLRSISVHVVTLAHITRYSDDMPGNLVFVAVAAFSQGALMARSQSQRAIWFIPELRHVVGVALFADGEHPNDQTWSEFTGAATSYPRLPPREYGCSEDFAIRV